MENENQEQSNAPQREPIGDVLKKYKQAREDGAEPVLTPPPTDTPQAVNESIPQASSFNPEQFQQEMSRETDPDLMMSYEVVKLPSKGLFYNHKISEVNVEYMTSKDEDLLTTPSLIENGTVLDVLLKRKVKTKGINPDELLAGDRNAIILFLRSSSYGAEYNVNVADPRTGNVFETKVDLLKLKYKKVKEQPNEKGHFNVNIPMRKKVVVFRLLTSGEENMLFKQAEALKDAMSLEFSEYSTMKLKSHIISIDGKSDKTYIDKFVDVMPALDALTIRKKILDVAPDVDMEYEFKAKDGYKFNTELSVGIDFFFPST